MAFLIFFPGVADPDPEYLRIRNFLDGSKINVSDPDSNRIRTETLLSTVSYLFLPVGDLKNVKNKPVSRFC
jgi:hypothetical protein